MIMALLAQLPPAGEPALQDPPAPAWQVHGSLGLRYRMRWNGNDSDQDLAAALDLALGDSARDAWTASIGAEGRMDIDGLAHGSNPGPYFELEDTHGEPFAALVEQLEPARGPEVLSHFASVLDGGAAGDGHDGRESRRAMRAPPGLFHVRVDAADRDRSSAAWKKPCCWASSGRKVQEISTRPGSTFSSMAPMWPMAPCRAKLARVRSSKLGSAGVKLVVSFPASRRPAGGSR